MSAVDDTFSWSYYPDNKMSGIIEDDIALRKKDTNIEIDERTPSPSSSIDSLFSTPITPQSQSPLMRSPLEIIHKVLGNSGGDDVISISNAAKTCRELRSFIYENPDQALWRDIHLQRYDDPRLAGEFLKKRTIFDWKKRIQDREFITRIFSQWDVDKYDELGEHFDLICSTLLDMYLDMPASSNDESSPSPLASDASINGEILYDVLRSETFQYIYHNIAVRHTQPHLRPLSSGTLGPHRKAQREIINPIISRLHVLLAPDFTSEDARKYRGYVRETVYTATNFREQNDWGPFDSRGRVDWNLVDAIGSVMMANATDVLSMGEDGWRQAVLPLSYGLDPVRGWGMNDLKRPAHLAENEVWDWAGVQGTWCGSYAFLDYNDWIALNEPRLVQLRRSLHQIDLSRYTEAIGDLMKLQLVIDQDASAASTAFCKQHKRVVSDLPLLKTRLPTSRHLPPIYFHGSSQANIESITYPTSSPASFVRGVVQLTADDPPQVRWTLVIRYGGEDRWRIEGVQVGGRGSKRGFFGVWTDAMKEERSPNGPVWYWKP